MNEADAGKSAAELIAKRIADLGDWRGETLSRMRTLIKDADPDVPILRQAQAEYAKLQ